MITVRQFWVIGVKIPKVKATTRATKERNELIQKVSYNFLLEILFESFFELS